MYSPQDISSEDLERVKELYLLYSVITKYADANYIESSPWEFGNFYPIKYAGIGYNIGIMEGQGTCFYCERVEISDDDNFINFEDIQMNKKRNEAKVINEKLEVLASQIKDLVKNEKVPIHFIESTIRTAFEELKNHS